MNNSNTGEIKYCLCGCGQVVLNKYVHGHNSKGSSHSLETKEKLRLASSSRKHRPESIEKMKLKHSGQVSPMKGKHHSEEAKNKLRNFNLGKPSCRKGKHHTEETIEKLKQYVGVLNSRYGKNNTIEHNQKISKSIKLKYQNIEYKEKVINGVFSYFRNKIKMNNLEQKLFEVIDQIQPKDWKFVGNGELIISGKCPDFININGKKKIIELFGSYWHSKEFRNDGKENEEHEGDRINHFKEFGYDTLIIWDKELSDIDTLKLKISKFTESNGD